MLQEEARRAVILAAGRGSRLGPMTEAQPKGMVALGGHPLIEWQIASLRAGGVEEVAIVTGYRAEVLATIGLPMFHNPRWAETNMVTSLVAAEPWLSSGPCLVSYADIFYAPSDAARLRHADATVAVAYDPDWRALWESRFEDPYADAESFRMDGDRIVDIGRKTGADDQIDGQYTGLMQFTPAAWAEVTGLLQSLDDMARARIDMTTLLRRLIERGVDVRGVGIEHAWGEVDHPSDLAYYQDCLDKGDYPWSAELEFRR